MRSDFRRAAVSGHRKLRLKIDPIIARIPFLKNVPKYAEAAWIDSAKLTHLWVGRNVLWLSGVFRRGDWDLSKLSLDSDPKFRGIMRHFRDGTPWPDCDIDEFSLTVEAQSREAHTCSGGIPPRYLELDRIFKDLKGLSVPRASPRQREGVEEDGILVHFDRLGVPLVYGGFHRLAMFKSLGFDVVPIQVGMVHWEARRSWRVALASPPQFTDMASSMALGPEEGSVGVAGAVRLSG